MCIAIALSASRARWHIKTKSPLSLFWAANTYYTIVIGIIAITGATFGFLGGVVYAANEELAHMTAGSVLLKTAIPVAIADRFLQEKYRRATVVGGANNRLSVQELYLAVLLWPLCIPAYLIGVGNSYDGFVSGENIGWGFSFYLLSCMSVPIIISWSGNKILTTIAVAAVVAIGFSFSLATDVRFLMSLPVLAVTYSLFAKRNRLNTRALSAIAIVLFVMYSVVNAGRYGAESSLFKVPESEIGNTFWGYIDQDIFTTRGSTTIRFTTQLLAWPLRRLGADVQTEKDLAAEIGNATMGSWAVPYAHFPGTWMLDIEKTSVLPATVEAVLFYLTLAIIVLLINNNKRLQKPFWPLLLWLQLGVVRGAIVTTAGTISAVGSLFLILFVVTGNFSAISPKTKSKDKISKLGEAGL
jgi:hypothetical protein